MHPDLQTNVLYYGDNLDILRRYLPDGSVDLVYRDPPFNLNRDYNVIFRDESGNATDAHLLASENTCTHSPSAESTYAHLTNTAATRAACRVIALPVVRADGGSRLRKEWEAELNPDDFPAPREGFLLTHFLVVSDQDRSRIFYQSLFDGQVLLERDPVIIKVANSWLTLNEGDGPTDDKPTVTLTTPPDPNRTSAFLNVRVADIRKVYEEWSAKGADFLTEPKDHGREIRAYIRDPDGHLIEVGQTVFAAR